MLQVEWSISQSSNWKQSLYAVQIIFFSLKGLPGLPGLAGFAGTKGTYVSSLFILRWLAEIFVGPKIWKVLNINDEVLLSNFICSRGV